MAQTLNAGDRIAAKVDAGGTDVSYNVNGDEITSATMADSYKTLVQGWVATVAAALYTPTAGLQAIVENIKIFNTHATLTRTVTLYRTLNSTTYDATTQWAVLVLAAGESAEWGDDGWSIYDANGLRKAVGIGTHTAAAHADITRSFFIPAIEMIFGGEQGGTAPAEMPIGVDLGVLPNMVEAVTLTDALNSGVHGKVMVPADAAGGALTFRPIWAPSAADGVAHTVAWRMSTKIVTGADPTTAGTVDTWTGDSATRTANLPVVETGRATTITPVAGDVVRWALSRDGGVAADSYVGDVNLLGIRVDYLANQ